MTTPVSLPAPTTAPSVYAARLRRVQAALHANGLDYLFVGPSADLLYLTGLDLHPSERLTLLVVHQEGPTTLILPAFEVAGVQAQQPPLNLAPWHEHEDPVKLVVRTVHGTVADGQGTIAVGDRLLAGFLLRLQAALPRAAFTNAQNVLASLRLVKDETEIALLREAGRRADAAFGVFRQFQFAGQTERTLAGQFAAVLREFGLQVEWGPIVGSGPNGASPHHTASDRVVEPGDLVVLDFGGRYQGYHADQTRTVAVGREPEAEARAVYEQVRAAQDAAVCAARPGLTCQALDAVARDLLNAGPYGKYFTHRLGHGIGLDGHEPPYLVQGNAQVLEAGMAFSIEPGLYLSGRFGVRIEDIVVLHPDGGERLNNTPHELLVV